MKKQIINEVIITNYVSKYTNKRGNEVTKSGIALIGEPTRAILESLRTLKEAGGARFSSYILPGDCSEAAKEVAKLAIPWVNPNTGENMTTAKGWIVDPKYVNALVTELKTVNLAAFKAEQAAKVTAREEKAALKAAAPKSGKAVKVLKAAAPVGSGAADKALALCVKALTKAGAWAKIPASTLSALNTYSEACGVDLKALRTLAELEV